MLYLCEALICIRKVATHLAGRRVFACEFGKSGLQALEFQHQHIIFEIGYDRSSKDIVIAVVLFEFMSQLLYPLLCK